MRGLLLLFLTITFASSVQGDGVRFADPLYRVYEPEGQVRSISLVVHGLNTRPTRMLPLVRFLNSQGSYVLNLSLSGHRWGTDMNFVSPSLWKREMRTALESAKFLSLHYGVPLQFVGYSLGALVGLATLQEMESGFIQRAVFLAPAISLTKKTYFMRLLTPFPHFGVPSLSPLNYRANWATSVACYNSVFSLKASLSEKSWGNLGFPALVLVDPKDELVNYKGLRQMLPSEWRLMPIDNSRGEARTFHHLILDPYVLGISEWTRMTGAIVQFMKAK